MARALAQVLSLLSSVALLVCVAAAVLWARSYFSADLAVLTAGTHAVSAHSAAGGMIVVHSKNTRPLPVSLEWEPQAAAADGGGSSRVGALFTFSARQMAGAGGAGSAIDRMVAFPHWALCAAGFVPLAWLETRRRWRRHFETSPCVKCGYVLRGNQGLCPNCRTPVGGYVA